MVPGKAHPCDQIGSRVSSPRQLSVHRMPQHDPRFPEEVVSTASSCFRPGENNYFRWTSSVPSRKTLDGNHLHQA
eukprot:5196361-Amphidinium_carterae.1